MKINIKWDFSSSYIVQSCMGRRCGEFSTFANRGVDGRPDGRSGVLGCNMNMAAASAPRGWPRGGGVTTTTNWV